MLKRMELYADAALLSFPVSVIVILLGSTLRSGGMLQMWIPFALVGGIVSVWLARMLHHGEISEPMSRDDTLVMLAVAAGAALIAVVLASLVPSGGGEQAMWIAVSLPVIALALAMLVDAVVDIIRTREHKVDDVMRILLIGFLGFMWLSTGFAGAVGPDVGPWVVGTTAYMLAVAVTAFAWDAIASRIASRSETHGPAMPAA